MLFLKNHGKSISSNGGSRKDLKSNMATACGFGTYEDYSDPSTIPLASFDYFFMAPSTPADSDIASRLDMLADAMIDQAPNEDINSDVPALFTYIGQFIDHDITANTDRETDFSKIDVKAVDLDQKSENDVRKNVANLRSGALDLDSLYGDNLHVGKFGKRLREAMRYPHDRAKMFLGTSNHLGDKCTPELPKDIASDLLRLGRLTQGTKPLVSMEEFDELDTELRKVFERPDGSINLAHPIIGDARNEENLAVAQTHLAFLRLHNKIVDAARKKDVDLDDREAVFTWARQNLRHIYQWLIVNEYLPNICDPEQLQDVLDNGAPIYGQFVEKINGKARSVMPMPLEFSVAAFRFGHSQARAEYDWNKFFGRGDTECPFQKPNATFGDFFAFTGGAPLPMAGTGDKLPSNWIPDLARMLNVAGETFDDRNTRKIDTHIVPPLHEMANVKEGMHAKMRNLPIRNLRRGHLLNIPTAQSCIAALSQQGVNLKQLTQEELTSGSTGQALKTAKLVDQTPLWFYVLKEAEICQNGNRLGPLGSRIVAETLAGLVIHGGGTYWREKGSDKDGRWHPMDGVKIDGHSVDSFAQMAHIVGYI